MLWAIYTLYKGPSNALYCGLVGYCGDRPADPDKIRLLQLYNVSRGEHATGISIDNEIFKDAIPATQFLAKRRDVYDLIPSAKIFTIIGHNRQASSGSKDKSELAHPFLEEKEDGKGSMILAHNGTINNIISIGQKYKVDHSHNTSSDSWTLTKILVNLKDEEMLELLKGYTGYANLLFYRTTTKNTLFVHKDPERPLFAFQETPTQMYISSIVESLVAIGGTKETIIEFEPFTIYKIVKGVVVKSWSTADRKAIVWESPKHLNKNSRETDWEQGYSNFQERKTFNDYYKESEAAKKSSNLLPVVANGFQYRGDSYYYFNGHRFTGNIYINTFSSEWSTTSVDGFSKLYLIMGIIMRDEKAFNELYQLSSNSHGVFDQAKWHKDVQCVDVAKYAEYPVKSNVNGVIAGTIYYPMAYHHEKYGNHKKSNIVFTPPLSLHTYCVTKQGVMISNIVVSDGPIPRERKPIIPTIIKPLTIVEGIRKAFKGGEYTDVATLFKAVLTLTSYAESEKIFEEFCDGFTDICTMDGVISPTDAASLIAAFDYSKTKDLYEGLNGLLEAYNKFLREDELKNKENEFTIELHIQDLQRNNALFNHATFISDFDNGVYTTLDELLLEHALSDLEDDVKPVMLAVALELNRLSIISHIDFVEIEQATMGNMYRSLTNWYDLYLNCIDPKIEPERAMNVGGTLATEGCCSLEDQSNGAILFRKFARAQEIEGLKRKTATTEQLLELEVLKGEILKILEEPDLIDNAALQMKYGISIYTIIEEYQQHAGN